MISQADRILSTIFALSMQLTGHGLRFLFDCGIIRLCDRFTHMRNADHALFFVLATRNANQESKQRILKVSPAFTKAAESRGRASGRTPQSAESLRPRRKKPPDAKCFRLRCKAFLNIQVRRGLKRFCLWQTAVLISLFPRRHQAAFSRPSPKPPHGEGNQPLIRI